MTFYLLDTDAVIDNLKGYAPSIALLQSLSAHTDTFYTCDIVIGEVHAGLYPADRARAEELLSALPFFPTTPEAAAQAGDWKFAYARRGQALALTDCIIAAVALDHGAQIVTANVKDFPMPEVTLLPLPRPGRGPS